MISCLCDAPPTIARRQWTLDDAEIVLTMCTQCKTAADVSIRSSESIGFEDKRLRFDNNIQYTVDDWLRCPKCLNRDPEIKRSGMVECDYCGLETEVIPNDR